MAFNPKEHLTKLRGADYLEVKWRLVWFRDEHPDWTIETEPVVLDIDKQVAIFHATIRDTEGRIIAQATKMETAKGFADFLEKAETGAVGRALAMCGYGTQFAPEFNEGERIVDAPVALSYDQPPSETARSGNGRNGNGKGAKTMVAETAPIPETPAATQVAEAPLCAACGKVIAPTAKYTVEHLLKKSVDRYGKPHCFECAIEMAKRESESEK